MSGVKDEAGIVVSLPLLIRAAPPLPRGLARHAHRTTRTSCICAGAPPPWAGDDTHHAISSRSPAAGAKVCLGSVPMREADMKDTSWDSGATAVVDPTAAVG